jgi:hypothetical protein
VITDHVDEGNVGTPSVVQIGEAISEAGPEVKQGDSRFAGNAGVAISGTGDHTFEKSQHATHAGLRVQCGNEVHFAGTGVTKTDFNPIGVQRGKK